MSNSDLITPGDVTPWEFVLYSTEELQSGRDADSGVLEGINVIMTGTPRLAPPGGRGSLFEKEPGNGKKQL